MKIQYFVGEFLTFLEKREERLLSWGFYNVSWTIEDINDAFDSEAPQSLQEAWKTFEVQGRSISSLIKKMQRQNLIYLVPDISPDAYRTRFAEGLRLLFNLRQRFNSDDWSTGPRLVSDIKLHITPRQYPRRDLTAEAVWDRLKLKCPQGDVNLMKQCFDALSLRGDAKMEFSGFQLRAFENILENYRSKGFNGSVVSAGTGSGKTKAFYVPAYLGMAPELKDAPYTKIIAIYPRNVLLADQLREAISEAEKLRPVLKDAGLRPIRFGALLGDTPRASYFDAAVKKKWHWERSGSGAVIPYLKSLSDGGRHDLIWRDDDRKKGLTCLYREGGDTPEVPDGCLGVTREELVQSPPDVLFLSVEMLNKEMCNPEWRRTFGMGLNEKSPRLLLLDEVHAYEGISGAQIAWVLRRWRYWSKVKSFHVVGLSATLRDAPQHLARVAGLYPSHVVEFRPVLGLDDAGEMEAEGAEYNIAVKGDPASGSALLSTTIQAGMLLARILTPRNRGTGGGQEIRDEDFFQKKVFGFSDKLDSVHRWLSNMSDSERHTDRHPVLASLRSLPSGLSDAVRRQRINEGQFWELPELIGHKLDQSLTVTGCSTGDPGVDSNSDLVVATSILEVGYDDPDVGIILHHKRPRAMSSFIQRKGRAGRSRGSRPWTVSILSDYGADRLMFNSAEKLFQPEVEAINLPILNPYVLRVQLTHYMLEWIGQRIGGNVFRYLSGPDRYDRQSQLRVKELLHELLEKGDLWAKFENRVLYFFRGSSGLDEDAARVLLDNLLWYEPRPLVMEVVPKLIRKIEADWSHADSPELKEDAGINRPLPQYIPHVTYAPLELGEVVLEMEDYRSVKRSPETMSTSQFFYECCPGRVSKRLAPLVNEPGYWHPFSENLESGLNTASIYDLFPNNSLLESINGIAIFEPLAGALIHRPSDIVDTSQGSWDWNTVVRLQGGGESLFMREVPLWREVFSRADIFLHSNLEWLEVLRYSHESRFEIRRGRESVSGNLRIQDEETEEEGGVAVKQAIGLKLRADGFRFVIDSKHLNSRPPVDGEMLVRFRADYFRHVMSNSPQLSEYANSFQCEWLADISLSMLTATALKHSIDLVAAQGKLNSVRSHAAERVLDVIFQVRGVSSSGEELDARLRTDLLGLWSNPSVLEIIIELEENLWGVPDDKFIAWTHRRYAATLAQVLHASMICLVPEVSEDDLVIDILENSTGGYDLILAESLPGGVGQVESIARELQRHPRRFLDGMEHALSHCSREKIARNQLAVNESVWSERDGEIANAFDRARTASGFKALEEAKEELRSALAGRGFNASRADVVSIQTKLLRPASNASSDSLIYRLNRRWRRDCAKFGVAFPLKSFAYSYVNHSKVGPFLEQHFVNLGNGETVTAPQLFAQLQQLLFQTCEDSCEECLDQRSKFYDLGNPSRALTREWLNLDIQTICISEHPEDWQDLAYSVIRKCGRVCVEAELESRNVLIAGLPKFIIEEINLEDSRVSISIARFEQVAGNLSVVLHIKDFVNV